ncbi:PREDICTED: uncharacterized protein LOC105368941 [Ceratosolen solmsi marchali]|uniref:Uncharacterized protein LOC105368941 n=1 Tax=Ceratosolen solmsi marchali TaxID=326594 RepID=A0AAJ6YXW5_9HYME|nr:PREDICTED: uncharacterized protein LOC105368941 [Ceratosolen solmsi marchali]
MDKQHRPNQVTTEYKRYPLPKKVDESKVAIVSAMSTTDVIISTTKLEVKNDFEKGKDNNNDLIKENQQRTVEKVAPQIEKPKKIPVIEQSVKYEPVRTAVPRTRPPMPTPDLEGRPVVLATHLVPSLPIGLFEVLAEAIEAATGKAVVLLHESRYDRPVAKDVADIAILPAGEQWEDGNLLPVSFVFEHRLNKNFSPGVYADVVVATDRAPHVENIMDLRGHRCALPDRRRTIGAATLLFNHLRAKGEGPAFFGNTLDAHSQVSALQMVAGKQVEVCILESPVIRFHRKSLPGVYSLHILSSLGPLPPYPIMVNKNMSTAIVNKIKEYLLKIRHDTEWIEKFAPYSVLGFTEYTKSLYDVQEIKSVATSAPYY